MAVTCVVADDHPAVLEAVVTVLESRGVDVVGSAGDGDDALRVILEKRPLVALVDLRMPGLTGIQIAGRVASEAPETAVLLYTGYGDRALLLEALDVGARGFVLKEAPLEDILRAIEVVASGGTYIDAVLAGVLASAEVADRLPRLTQREREILRLLADGLRNEEVGRRLYISTETVRTHVRKAMEKLDADTRTQAVATAFRSRLIA